MNTQGTIDTARDAGRPLRSHLRRVLVAFAAVALTAGNVTAPAPAQAASPIIDSYITAPQITYISGSSIYVSFTAKKPIPAGAGLTLSWKYVKASRDSTGHSQVSLAGGAGLRQVLLSGAGDKIMPIRVVAEIHLPGVNEERSVLGFNGPTTGRQSQQITQAEAVATAIGVKVPGILLYIVPSTRALKVTGGMILGWSIFSDVQRAFTGSANTCPTLAAGQFYVTDYTYSLSGSQVVLNYKVSVWNTFASFTSAAAPVCSYSFEGARFS